MDACSVSSVRVPLNCTAISPTSATLKRVDAKGMAFSACPSSRSLHLRSCCNSRASFNSPAAKASSRSSQLVIPGRTSTGHSFLGTFRPPHPTCKKFTTCLISKGQPISAADNNGKGDPPEKRQPRNKLAVEPTLGDKVMIATTKLLNVTAYPLGIAGLVVVLPVVWGVRLYKALTMEPLDMKDKVVLMTGASSGIGEHMAYEYARLGARLGLVARRGEKLEEVAEEARLMGSPDVLVIEQDIGTEEGCKAAVDAALAHFETLDTLALNAGLFHAYLFTDATDTKRFDSIMDVNFWGYVYMTYHALEHLERSRGQIVVNSSVSSIVPQPRNSIYNASKAAVTNFFHTLRIELGDRVPITIFSPGVTKSELSDGKMSHAEGKVPGPEKARDLRNEQLGLYPIVPTAMMARNAVKAARYKKHDIILPVWYNMLGVYRALAPEVLDAGLRLWIAQDPPMAKRVIDTFDLKVGQPTKDQYEAGGFPKEDERKEKEKPREKAGSRR